MPSLTTVLLLALVPAAGNFLGGVLAEVVRPSPKALSLALHAAAGVVIAVVALEIAPRSLDVEPGWAQVLAFVAGGLFFLAADAALGIARRRAGEDEKGVPRAEASGSGEASGSAETSGSAGPSGGAEAKPGGGPWLIYFAVSVDLFSDGVMIGAGATLSAGLALVLALGQVVADLPEGFATIATLRKHGLSRGRRLALSASFALPVLAGACVGWFGVREASEAVKVGLLVFTAGVLTTVTVEEIVPEAHEENDGRTATLAFVLGFAAFMAVSRYVG